jgi:hypothetical protein
MVKMLRMSFMVASQVGVYGLGGLKLADLLYLFQSAHMNHPQSTSIVRADIDEDAGTKYCNRRLNWG